jgi:amidase
MPEQWWFSFRPGAPRNVEIFDLSPYAYEEFLRSCRDALLPSWKVVDASRVFPDPPGSVEAKGRGLPHGYAETKAAIVAGVRKPADLPGYREALEGIERLRKSDFEAWLAEHSLDALVFPANADIGRADSDVNEASYDDANRNGVRFSNMNHAIRHLGIPSVSVSMGIMSDTSMPVNLTFAGAAYSDNDLLRYAHAYEQATRHRRAPGRVQPLSDEIVEYDARTTIPHAKRAEKIAPVVSIDSRATQPDAPKDSIRFSGTAQDASSLAVVRIYINGHKISESTSVQWIADVPAARLQTLREPNARSVAVLVIAKDKWGNAGASVADVTLPGG